MDCRTTRRHARELVADELAPGPAAALRGHAAGCAACARHLRQERLLHELLGALPAAPRRRIDAPELPAHAPARGRVLLARPGLWAAASAAAAVLAIAWFARSEAGDVETTAPSTANAPELTFVDDLRDPPPADDDLLALTAGVEAVVMRRPALGR